MSNLQKLENVTVQYRSPALTSPRTTRSLSSPRNIKVKHQASDLSLSLHYLLLLGLGEVVLYVEGFSDFLWGFAFDHVRRRVGDAV